MKTIKKNQANDTKKLASPMDGVLKVWPLAAGVFFRLFLNGCSVTSGMFVVWKRVVTEPFPERSGMAQYHPI